MGSRMDVESVVAHASHSAGVVVVLRWLVGVYLVVGASLKVLEPDALRPALEFLSLGGDGGRWVAGIVVTTEMAVGLGLIFVPGRRLALVALVMLGSYSVVLGSFLVLREPPSCGCLGLVRLFESNRAESAFGLGRNLLMMAVVVVAPTTGGRHNTQITPASPPAPGA